MQKARVVVELPQNLAGGFFGRAFVGHAKGFFGVGPRPIVIENFAPTNGAFDEKIGRTRAQEQKARQNAGEAHGVAASEEGGTQVIEHAHQDDVGRRGRQVLWTEFDLPSRQAP